MTTTKTRSQEAAAEITALLRARTPMLWVVSSEEARVEQWLIKAAADAGYVPRTWDCGQGVASLAGVVESIGSNDIGETLGAIKDRAQRNERGAWIMRDLPVWLVPPVGIVTCRQLRNLARFLPGTPRESAQAIVVLSPSSDVPAELRGHATVIEWPMPDRAEIAKILDAAIEALPDELRETAATNGTRDAAIDAAVGLSGEEAQSCYAKSLVQFRKIDPAAVAREKKRVITREKVLEWFDPLPGGLDAVGGLDVLKAWLVARKAAYSAKAREYGLPAPRGAMLVGVPGCGKSLTAKAIATAWGIPLLRLDMGALKSKFVGESEGNLRRAFRTIEAIGRCVVWCDEIEKSLDGATSGGADGGVSADALGTLLSWMQERQGESFVIATANDVSKLPSELLRAGRFDAVWFIDLPTSRERSAILSAALVQHGRTPAKVAADTLAVATEGFTGSEIAALVPDALFAAFADNAREITTKDLLTAAQSVVPLAKTAAEKVTALRSWAVGRARSATSAETASAKTQPKGRALDL
jgi:hypothetical protein